jgi:uncharacterized protein YutE (UPF0331/DUF86 family)
MIDSVLISRKFKLIIEDLKALESMVNMKLDDYLIDRTVQAVAERYLERMIGRMIDVNFHILSETNNPPPPDYFRSFTELAKIRVLPPDFAKKIAHSAGLRNRLVHEYDEIEAEKIYQGVKAAVEDVPKYMDLVNCFIEKKNKS